MKCRRGATQKQLCCPAVTSTQMGGVQAEEPGNDPATHELASCQCTDSLIQCLLPYFPLIDKALFSCSVMVRFCYVLVKVAYNDFISRSDSGIISD